jgi:DNA-directed RNA polymerase specialized sigma24 family protein
MAKNSLKEAIAKKKALIEACERTLSAAEARQKSALEGGGWGDLSSRPDQGSILRLIEKKQHEELALRELESLQPRMASDDNPPIAREGPREPPKPPAPKPKLPAKKKTDLSQYIDACHKLTSHQRECFSLRFEYGMTFQEIGAYRGINRGTAKTHVDAANRKIKQLRSLELRRKAMARHDDDQ